MENDIKKQLKNLPKDAGCYLFKDKKEKIIYIGKAVNLKNRVSQYFRKSEKQSLKTQKLVENIFSVDFVLCDSEIDALIEEARLIKKYDPKYNVLLRDDKNYFFVGVTKEEFPRIFITHQPLKAISYNLSTSRHGLKANYIGPFTDGFALKQTLKILRNIFPYRHCLKMPKKPCLQYHLGRCLAPCKLERSGHQIQTNIKEIKSILSGKKQTVLKKLEKEMKNFAEKENFERANELKKKIESLKKIFAHRNYLENFKRIKRKTNWEDIEKYIYNLLNSTTEETGFSRLSEVRGKTRSEASEIEEGLTLRRSGAPGKVGPCESSEHRSFDTCLPAGRKKFAKNEKFCNISRVECYDISNISGKNAVGSMVVFKDGIPDKKEYRKFNIKSSGDEPNDPKMMQEVLERRIKHMDWPMPDLIIVDGGITQLNAARKAVGEKYPILSIAKKNEEIYLAVQPPSRLRSPIPTTDMPSEVKYFFQQIRDEAHRFAITFHRQKRSKTFFTT